jgi:hypothetical protein
MAAKKGIANRAMAEKICCCDAGLALHWRFNLMKLLLHRRQNSALHWVAKVLIMRASCGGHPVVSASAMVTQPVPSQ